MKPGMIASSTEMDLAWICGSRSPHRTQRVKVRSKKITRASAVPLIASRFMVVHLLLKRGDGRADSASKPIRSTVARETSKAQRKRGLPTRYAVRSGRRFRRVAHLRLLSLHVLVRRLLEACLATCGAEGKRLPLVDRRGSGFRFLHIHPANRVLCHVPHLLSSHGAASAGW